MNIDYSELRLHCFRIDDIGIKEGDIIEPGRWGSIVISSGELHKQYKREQLLENIRLAQFPHLPSRLTSNFAFKYWDDADRFHELRWNGGHKQHMYLTVPTDLRAVSHAGYMSCLPPIEDYADADIARAYWQAQPTGFGIDFISTSPVELVIPSPLRVLRVLSVQS